MRTLTILIVFLFLNTGVLANDSTVSTYLVDTVVTSYPQKHSIPMDTLKSRFGKLAEVSGECFVMVKDGMRSEGVVGYIIKHLDAFAPIIVFFLLYVVWRKRKEKI